MRRVEADIDALLLILIILLLIGLPGYWWTGREGYAGPDRFSLLGFVVAIIVIVLVVRLLGVI